MRSERYALRGVIDVLTHVQLSGARAGNVIRDTVRSACPTLSGTFEVIVDYKGSHRPALDEPERRHWDLGEWQVQTYAWLREKQQLSYHVAAGMLIYINELAPNEGDIQRLRRVMGRGQTDVAPLRGDPDYYALQSWTLGTLPRLSEAFRFRRAIRVIPVDAASIDRAAGAFDAIVQEIEGSVVDEGATGSIMATWRPTCREPETCAACDFRYFCPNPASGTDAALRLVDEDEI